MLKKTLTYRLIILFLCTSCSNIHINHKETHTVGLKSAFEEITLSKKSRNLATDIPTAVLDIDFNIDDFREINVMMFPKINQDNLKNGESLDPNVLLKYNNSKGSIKDLMEMFTDYDRPQFFRFSKVESQSCYRVRRNTQYDAGDFFGNINNFKNNKELKCLIIKVVRKTKNKTNIPKRNILKGDILEIDLYMDEYFRPYGKRIIYATKDKDLNQTKIVKIKYNQRDSFNSDLSEFPIDLPNLASHLAKENWNYKGVSPLKIPTSHYIQNIISKRYSTPKCNNGYSLKSKNILGNNIHTGWCKGSSFPVTINTVNYFAIIKK